MHSSDFRNAVVFFFFHLLLCIHICGIIIMIYFGFPASY